LGFLDGKIELSYPEGLKQAGRLFIAGLVMLLLSYGLSFTHTPLVIRGNATSVHVAATLGGSIMCAGIFWAILLLAEFYQKKKIAAALIALYFSLLVGFHFVVQNDYVRSWRNQRTFWKSVVSLCPDLDEGTVIFVEPHGLPETKYVHTTSWAYAIILKELLRFPKEWKKPPRLFVLSQELKNSIRAERDRVRWQVPVAMWNSHSDFLSPGNLIWLEMRGNELTRRNGILEFECIRFPLKEKGSSPPIKYEKGPFYDYLIQN
jgi:hypothetical protein